MSTSQRAPVRRVRRPAQGPGGDLRGSPTPQEVDGDSSFPCHSPSRDSDERFDSVLLSSRSTTSLNRLHTPSNTARVSAAAEAPLSYSPQLAMRSGNGGAKTTANDGGVPLHRVEGSGSNEGDRRRDTPGVLRTTPEKTTMRPIVEGGSGSTASPVRTNSEGKGDEGQMKLGDESLSFEFYNTHHQHHQHHQQQQQNRNTIHAHGKSNITASDVRIPRGIVGHPCRESPMAPNMLPMVPIPDSFSQRYVASISSRDQQGDGRYAAMSQSSRFEDANQLTPRPVDGDGSFADGAARPGAPMLDDIVRFSTTDSFVGDEAAGQPPRVDASMNSQNFIRNYKRRQAAQGTAGRGGGGGGGAAVCRYGSTSITGSPQMSADVAAARPGGHGGPSLISSDQLARMPTAHGGRRRGGNGGEEAGGDRQDGTVLGTRSFDTMAQNGNASTSFSPSMDDFAVVRAPVSGLRAKVLGNTAVDEDEAAEDPEARELLAKQIQSFVSKLARQRQEGGLNVSPSQQPLVAHQPPSSSQSTAPGAETRADILRRANAEAAAAVERTSAGSIPQTGKDDAAPASDDSASGRRKAKKSKKRVRFNLEGLVPRDVEGPNALRMPQHGATRHDGDAVKRPVSPPAPASSNDDMTSPGREDEWEGMAVVPGKRHSTAQVVDVRSVLRAGVSEQRLATPSSPVMDTSVLDEEEVVVQCASSPRPARYPVATSASTSRGVPVQRTDSSDRNDDASDDQPRCTPASPSTAVPFPVAVLPASKTVPVPPAPTAVMQLTSSTQEPHQQPRRRSAGKVRKATKMHRKAAVALVAGASESVVVARSSTSSSVQHSLLTPLRPPNGSVLSSMEVGLSEGSPQQSQLHGSLSGPLHHAPANINTNLNSGDVTPTAVSPVLAASPKRMPAAEADVSTPTHRIRMSSYQSHRPAAATPSSTTTLAPPAPAPQATTPPPLHVMQVVPPRLASAVPVIAASPRGAETHACGPARRTTTTAAAPVKGATAPSSRRSSLSLAGGPTPRSGTYMELPPLSSSSRSCTSTPDVVAPPQYGGDANATGAASGEVTVLLPAALLRRPSASHDTVASCHSAGEYLSSPSAAPTSRGERSCSTAEFRAERALSPASTASDKSTGTIPSKVQVMQLSTHALPRLSSSSLKAHSATQSMSPPSV